jgi:hypothetical protein
VVQFWDDPAALPNDVRECLDSWRPLEERGFRRLLFDDHEAGRFIAKYFGMRHIAAFEHCFHPAMRCDYFRLCYIARNGGFYIDADEYYQGADCEYLFLDNKLKLQPLCYDTSTGAMVQTEIFTTKGNDSPDWIFYVNNNPLIAPPSHPVVCLALARSTRILLSHPDIKQDIQSTTGPGNLTASLVSHPFASEVVGSARDFALLPHWDAVSVSRWPLSYRSDARNWRLWSRSQ